MGVLFEFYGPFAHIPGRYEWARIASTTHGPFDCFIVIHTGTDKPVTVYVNSDSGERFMRERYPESRSIRIAEENLRFRSDESGLKVEGRLSAAEGPVRRVLMRFEARGDAPPRAVAYGDPGRPVWGSRFACEGVDMELPALVSGEIELAPVDDPERPTAPSDAGTGAAAVTADRDAAPPLEGEFSGIEGIVTLGSYGKITPIGG